MKHPETGCRFPQGAHPTTQIELAFSYLLNQKRFN